MPPMQKTVPVLSDLPLELLALVLELVDYRSLACFEIALPSSANIVRWWKMKRLYVEIRKSDLCINPQSTKEFIVGYPRAVACLHWIKERANLSTLFVSYTRHALRHYQRKLQQHEFQSPSLIQYMKIVKFIDIWSQSTVHFIADIYPTFFPDEISVFTCVPRSTTTDSMTINYRKAYSDHVCYVPTDCEKDKLMGLPNYSIDDARSTFDLFGRTNCTLIKLLLRTRRPKELRFLGHVHRHFLNIFYPESGPIATSVEKLVLYMPSGYELYDWDNDATGLHTWFPSLRECTLIDPTFPSDLEHIWSVVTKFLDANRPLLLKLMFLKCSRESEYLLLHDQINKATMARSLAALTLDTMVSLTELDNRTEIIFKRLDVPRDAAAVHVVFD